MKMKSWLFTGMALICALPAFAQRDKNRAPAERKVVLSVSPLSLLNYSPRAGVRAEYVVNRKNSLALDIGIPKKGEMPAAVLEQLYTNEESNENIKNAASKVRSFSFQGAFRIYKRRNGAPRGFYYAPYFRYARYALDYEYTRANGYDTYVDGEASTFGVGMLLGKQWLIGSRVSIDLGFLGLGVQRGNLSSSHRSEDPAKDYAVFAQQLDERFSELPLIGKCIDIYADGQTVKSEAAGCLLPDLRLSLTVGVAF